MRENYLEHHGVLGQKWGVRKDKKNNRNNKNSKNKGVSKKAIVIGAVSLAAALTVIGASKVGSKRYDTTIINFSRDKLQNLSMDDLRDLDLY